MPHPISCPPMTKEEGGTRYGRHFPNLDAIRFIAAMMVFFCHTLRPLVRDLHLEGTIAEPALMMLSNGNAGVSIFFVLSGFLITWLLLREYTATGGVALKAFYLRRVLRIWPLYFAVILFTFAVYPMLKSFIGMNDPRASQLPYYLFFLSNFDVIRMLHCCKGMDALSQNVTWSVSVEEQFYLFWPLIFALLPKRAWLPCILLVVASSIGFRMMRHSDEVDLYFHTVAVLLDLGIGGAFAYAAFTGGLSHTWLTRSSERVHGILLALSMVLIILSAHWHHVPYGTALFRIALSISFALNIASQALAKRTSRLALGRWRFAERWGKYTYGIYLIHPIVITLLGVAFRFLPSGTGTVRDLLFICLCLVLTLVLSKWSHIHFESRFLALSSRLRRKSAPLFPQ